MSFPDLPDDISVGYLETILRVYLGEPGLEVADFDVQRLSKGTSGAGLYLVSTSRASDDEAVRVILKYNGGLKEVLFYRDLASRIPVDSPRVLDARILDDGGTWLVMEEITGVKDGLSWDEADYQAVVSDMARLHAKFWGRTELLDDCAWLRRPSEQTLSELVAARKKDVDVIAASWAIEALPEVFGTERLARVKRMLEEPEKVFGPLFAAGATLVHGDYWFYNVQVTDAGRRVLIDWQDAQVWSGLWELAYFLNLLLVVESGDYRENLPVDEGNITAWYADALAEAGVVVERDVFDKALLAARVWHPVQHWIRQYGYAISKDLLPSKDIRDTYPGAIEFLAATFARWDEDVRALLDE